MAIIHLAVATRNALADAVNTLMNGGSGAATAKIYTGTIVATGDTAESGTLLATVVFADPATGSASSGVITGTDPASVNAVASGTAGWFRVEDSAGANVFDGDVTATGGGGTMTLSTTSITSGSPVDITSFTVTMPAS